jgi:hypothetical protein
MSLGFDAARFAVGAVCRGRDVTFVLQPVKPADRARRAHPKPLRRLAETMFNGVDYAAMEIGGTRFGHPLPAPFR